VAAGEERPRQNLAFTCIHVNLPKLVEISSIYNSVPKSKIWQSFQLSIYKLFLAANKYGGGEDYSLQMLCKINRGFLVTMKSTNVATFGKCLLKCDLR